MRMYKNGSWEESQNGMRYDVCSPATGQVIGSVPLASEKDVAQAVRAACEAQKVWQRVNPFLRGAMLRRAAEKVEQKLEQIANVMTSEQGKTKNEARQEVAKGAQILRYYAEEGERVLGRIIPNDEANCISNVIYQPIGVAAAITPWNYPIELLAWKIGGALAAGCAIICKLPWETPLSPTMFVECVAACITEAGFPGSILQTLTGHGSEIGEALAAHPDVRRLAFTGSTSIGKKLAVYQSQLKHISLELGGSLPMLVFQDCDIEAAVKGCVRRSFRNNGQICIAINRVYVHETIYETFLKWLVRQVKALRIGDTSLREDVDLGPMCTAKGVEKVRQHVEDAKLRGARILTGGKRPEGTAYQNGFFYEPTIIADATQEMQIMQEETFGPAIGVAPFKTIRHAIDLANDTPYGLAAICYTKNIDVAYQVATGVDAGNIAINNVDAGVLNAPYGGWKDSGIGCEHGREGLFEYLHAKHIRIRFEL